jgi:hypothetical protein
MNGEGKPHFEHGEEHGGDKGKQKEQYQELVLRDVADGYENLDEVNSEFEQIAGFSPAGTGSEHGGAVSSKDAALLPPEVQRLKEAGYSLAPLEEAQVGENEAPGVAAADSDEYKSNHDAVERRLREVLRMHVESDGAAERDRRDRNTRRYLALMGIGLGVASAAAVALGALYAMSVSQAKGESPSDSPLPSDLRDKILAKIDAWLKATAKDEDFWEQFAKLSTSTDLKPPLAITDHIPFCSYVIDHFPVATPFLFASTDDSTFYVMHLVAAYLPPVEAGKGIGEGAAAMYRKVTQLRHAASGGTTAPFPRQVQALLLRDAFVAIAYPAPAAALMRLAVELLEPATQSDADYWRRFSAYAGGTTARPPLTPGDEILFCGYTAALARDDGFYFERQETEPDFIARLVAVFDTAKKSTAGLYALAPTLSVTPGTPLPRRVQAQLLRSALSQIDTADSGKGLYDLAARLRAEANDDAAYWQAFVAHLAQAKPPLLRKEEIFFCTYTVQQSPVPAGYTAPTPDEFAGYVASIASHYQRGGADQPATTAEMYPALARLLPRPPQLPRAQQAQVMRAALVQLDETAAG